MHNEQLRRVHRDSIEISIERLEEQYQVDFVKDIDNYDRDKYYYLSKDCKINSRKL